MAVGRSSVCCRRGACSWLSVQRQGLPLRVPVKIEPVFSSSQLKANGLSNWDISEKSCESRSKDSIYLFIYLLFLHFTSTAKSTEQVLDCSIAGVVVQNSLVA